ncbi:MAG TPA: YncE family protein, partial [Geminicoccaceae bacterium]
MSHLARFVMLATVAMTAAAAPGLALDAADGYVFVPNRGSADIAVIDTRTDRLVTRLPVGRVPHQVVVSDVAGKLVASNTADDTLSIVDLSTLRTTTLELDDEPEHMALAPDGLLLAIGNIAAGTISLVSLEHERELARVPGLFDPHNLTFSPDGALLYVANLGANHVSVIDVASARVVDEIPVGRPPAVAAAGGIGAEFQGIINVTPTL